MTKVDWGLVAIILLAFYLAAFAIMPVMDMGYYCEQQNKGNVSVDWSKHDFYTDFFGFDDSVICGDGHVCSYKEIRAGGC